MFTALVKKKKPTTKAVRSANASASGTSRPRSCDYTNGEWVCTLANGRKLTVSGQSFIKQLRTAASGSRSIRGATLRYPNSGSGQCMLHITYANGRTEVVRGRCTAQRGSNPPAIIRAQRGSTPSGPTPSGPTPSGPTPSGPTPSGPTPSGPTPSGPTGHVPDLGGRCCFDPELMLIVCDDPRNPYNGREVIEITSVDEGSGYALLRLKPLASSSSTMPAPEYVRAPLCPDESMDVPDEPATPGGSNDCCYDPILNKLLCKDPSSPLNGADVTLETINEGAGPNGEALATVYVGGDPAAGMRVPVCETPQCCLDLATSSLLCENDPSSPFNGLRVNVEQVGQQQARVSHPDLQPYGFAYVPLCATPPEETGDCCFDQDTMQIVCPDASNPLDGQTAGIVVGFQYADGTPGVSISWPGGAARMPLCGQTPPEQCPPSYCCVNIDTMTFVCPGTPELNGQAADVVDIHEQGGFTYAVLADNTVVPVCGSSCPPPELCPDGMWRTPTGECVMPPECPECPTAAGDCPTCPPGMLLDTSTGKCISMPVCPECPPERPCDDSGGWPYEEPCCETSWWKDEGFCCESCAHGKECEGGCGDDCDCGKEGPNAHSHDHGQAASPPWMGPASWIAAR